MRTERCVDFLYLAYNRKEFTIETFSTLIETTDWQYVNEFFVYDDGSVDGTREWLEQKVTEVPARVRFVKTNFGSPVTAMNHFIQSSSAPILAKTDNDAMLPPSWLRLSLEVMDRHPQLELLGIEAMYPHSDDVALPRSYTPALFISGLGLYRRDTFRRGLPPVLDRYFGFEEWQVQHRGEMQRGWITPALPVFLLDRFPLAPWRDLSDEYIRRGWQRQSYRYASDCTLWKWWSKAHPVETPVNVLCAMRIKNESAQIRQVLESVLPLCGSIYILDDHSTDNTVQICESFGDRVTVFRSPFEGLDEARDKNYLLKLVMQANPEWVLWIDGDEELEPAGVEAIRAVIRNPTAAAIHSVRVAYLWDDSEHVRIDGIWGSFTRPSLFRLRGQTQANLVFPTTRFGGNLHCGNVPVGVVGGAGSLDVRLKHYGYIDRAQRQRKYGFYNDVDPNNQAEDCYRHLAEVPGALHAPGPPQIIRWPTR